MSDIWKIVLTAGVTLIGGTILFLIGKAMETLVFTPLQKYKEQAQVALERTDFYANRLTNFFSNQPGTEEAELMRQISDELRGAATQLKAKYAVISFKKYLVKTHIIPSSGDLGTACGNLFLLSNNLPTPNRDRGSDAEHSPISVNNTAIDRIKQILES